MMIRLIIPILAVYINLDPVDSCVTKKIQIISLPVDGYKLQPEKPTTRCLCGMRNSAPQMRIINGTDTVENEFPWQVGLVTPDGKGGRLNYFTCGGSIISSKTIITAAHCLEGYEKEGVNLEEIAVGEHDTSKENDGEMYVKVCNSFKHKMYNKTEGVFFDYDFAIVILCKDLTWSRTVSPVCLPNIDERGSEYEGKNAIVTGWGRMLSPTSPASNTLKRITKRTMSNPECQRSVDFFKSNFNFTDPKLKDIDISKINVTISPRQICDVAPHKSSCNGDSGGPMVVKKNEKKSYTLAGIVSWGAFCMTNEAGIPDIKARITEVLPWIKKSMEGTTCIEN